MAGIKVGSGADVTMLGGGVYGGDIGVEVEAGGSFNVSGAFFDTDVADIAYEDGARVEIVNTYANKLFNLTEGEFSRIDSDLNFIAYHLIQAQDPSTVLELTDRLYELYTSVPDWMRTGVKYDIARRLIEYGYQYAQQHLPYFHI